MEETKKKLSPEEVQSRMDRAIECIAASLARCQGPADAMKKVIDDSVDALVDTNIISKDDRRIQIVKTIMVIAITALLKAYHARGIDMSDVLMSDSEKKAAMAEVSQIKWVM